MTLAPYDWVHQTYEELRGTILFCSIFDSVSEQLELLFYYKADVPTFKSRLVFKNSDLVYLVASDGTFDIKKIPTLFHMRVRHSLFEGILIEPGEILLYLKNLNNNLVSSTLVIKVFNTEHAILFDH